MDSSPPDLDGIRSEVLPPLHHESLGSLILGRVQEPKWAGPLYRITKKKTRTRTWSFFIRSVQFKFNRTCGKMYQLRVRVHIVHATPHAGHGRLSLAHAFVVSRPWFLKPNKDLHELDFTECKHSCLHLSNVELLRI